MLRSAAVGAGISSTARCATDPLLLLQQVADLLLEVVPFTRWYGLLLDPATLQGAGGTHARGLPALFLRRLLEIEVHEPDFNSMLQLSRAGCGISTIDRATEGNPQRSKRFREVLAPAGLGRELRAVLRVRDHSWGGLVLLRSSEQCDFSDTELDFVRSVAPDIASGLRTCQLSSLVEHAHLPDSPGVAVLGVGGTEVTVEMINPTAQRWLDDIPDDRVQPSRLPLIVVTLALHVLRWPARVARARLRGRSSVWLTLHVESGGPTQLSLVIEPTRPRELADVIAIAYGFTPRELEVARLVIEGNSNDDIARALRISPYTVADHLKRCFKKLGAQSRAELTSRLFFDQHPARPTVSR